MKYPLLTLLLVASTVAMTGCASVKMGAPEATFKAKSFTPPSDGKAGLYLYRDSFIGAALKKDLWVDGECIGATAHNMFFFTEIEGGKNHKIETESEFSPNALELFTEPNKNYFVRQYIKMGVFVGGANLEQIPEEQGKAAVMQLQMGEKGHCDSSYNKAATTNAKQANPSAPTAQPSAAMQATPVPQKQTPVATQAVVPAPTEPEVAPPTIKAAPPPPVAPSQASKPQVQGCGILATIEAGRDQNSRVCQD